ncbi:MAG: hypothetical protein AAFV53_28430 [Myxococcota bacterium]
MSYYKQIDGVRYDRALIEAAEAAVAGRGDGRISKADAEVLFTFVIDGGKVTDIEAATIAHIRETMTWTEAADAWFTASLEKWTQNPVSTARSTRSADKPAAVLMRLSRDRAVAHYIDADAAAQAPDGAVVLMVEERLPEVWPITDLHKSADLPDRVEKTLVHGGLAFFHANVRAFVGVFGTVNNRITVHVGFTNVNADIIEGALDQLGFAVTDADSLI